MQSSNPVLTRLGEAARASRYETSASPSRSMTMDDVVVRTVALLAITGITGAAAWILLPASSPVTYFAAFMAGIAGLVLGLVISFRRVTSPAVIIPYAVLQGVALGVVSRAFESFWSGIVIQAVAATFGIFVLMAALYKFKVLRATPRFTKFVIGALIGVVVLSFANWLFYLFGLNLGLRVYTADIQPKFILELLLFDEDFPRSLRFATARIEEHLIDLAQNMESANRGGPERLAGRLKARLEFADVDELETTGASALLATVNAAECARIHDAVYDTFVAYPLEMRLPA